MNHQRRICTLEAMGRKTLRGNAICTLVLILLLLAQMKKVRIKWRVVDTSGRWHGPIDRIHEGMIHLMKTE